MPYILTCVEYLLWWRTSRAGTRPTSCWRSGTTTSLCSRGWTWPWSTVQLRTPLPWASVLYCAKTWLPKKEYLQLWLLWIVIICNLNFARSFLLWQDWSQWWSFEDWACSFEKEVCTSCWLNEVLAGNAEAKRRLVIVLMFRRESRLLDCEDSLLPSWCLAWNWSWDKGEGDWFLSILFVTWVIFGENKEIMRDYHGTW